MTKKDKTTVEVITPKKSRKRKSPVQTIKKMNREVIIKAKEVEEIAKEKTQQGEVGGFMNFLKAQNVAGLAIGLAVGTAASSTVKQFVQSFVDPIVQLLVGSQESLQQAEWTIKIWKRSAEFQWGAFLSSFITLIATAAVIYAFLRISGLYSVATDDKGKKK